MQDNLSSSKLQASGNSQGCVKCDCSNQEQNKANQSAQVANFKTVRVAAALIVEGQSFLVAQRQGKRHLAGYYELPGGKIEDNETPEQACIREIKEELGCDIKVESYLLTCEYDYPDVGRHLSMDVFVCRLQDGQQIEMKEHSDLRFVDAQSMDTIEFAPADVQFLPQIKELLSKL